MFSRSDAAYAAYAAPILTRASNIKNARVKYFLYYARRVRGAYAAYEVHMRHNYAGAYAAYEAHMPLEKKHYLTGRLAVAGSHDLEIPHLMFQKNDITW